MAKAPKGPRRTDIASLTHRRARRKNIPTMEQQSFVTDDEATPVRLAYPRRFSPEEMPALYARDPQRDPQLVWAGNSNGGSAVQLVWKGKDEEDRDPLSVEAVPIYVQEKIHPKAIIDDVRRMAKADKAEADGQPDLFSDFNGYADEEDKLEFYQHDVNWSNRMILGDSLQVMASLAEKEGLRGKVQCIYMDPPYGIKFNSNWQVSTKTPKSVDGKRRFESREPEVVRAFRDTWAGGIHSYLGYLRDRILLSYDLLSDSGSFFIQIGDKNIHYVKCVLDEVFGDYNFCAIITVAKTASQTADKLAGTTDFIIWYTKDQECAKFRALFIDKGLGSDKSDVYRWHRDDYGVIKKFESGNTTNGNTSGVLRYDNITSQRPPGDFIVNIFGQAYTSGKGFWKTGEIGMTRLIKAERVRAAENSLTYIRFLDDFPAKTVGNLWTDTGTGSFTTDKIYVVQTGTKVIERCILMTTDPGDLVLDPTCGSGTTAYVAEQWGRRWITIDTSRVALSLARTRLMSSRYSYYVLKDSEAGAFADEELHLKRTLALDEAAAVRQRGPFRGDVGHGFVYERVPHVTLKSIANNAEIDVIWEKWQATLEPLRTQLNTAADVAWEEWQVPRPPVYPWEDKAQRLHAKIGDLREEQKGASADEDFDPVRHEKKIAKALRDLNKVLGRSYTLDSLPEYAGDPLPDPALPLHTAWWEARRARQAEIDASIARNADIELLVDKPLVQKGVVRVAGPFTVESLSPHRVLPADEDDPFLLAAIEDAEADGQSLPKVRLATKPAEAESAAVESDDFIRVVLDNLKKAGVGNTKKHERLRFTALRPFPGRFVNAEGRYVEGETEDAPERKAAIFIGPEYGTVTRGMIVQAAREAADLFDVLVVCGFAFEAHASGDTMSLGRLTVLKVNMNQDLRMGDRLKSADQGNLFVVFGEPDVDVRKRKDGLYEVEIRGVDIFNPNTGELKPSSKVEDDIACWFIDDDYDDQSFFVRQAYFLGGKDPYQKLKSALKAEIDEDAWAVLYSKISRPFEAPSTGRIAVKVINHYGDEVMKVFDIDAAKGR